MTHLPRLLIVAAIVLLAGCVVAPYPYGAPVVTTTPASFDRSWDAALGAAGDVGVQVTSTDYASGRITGNKAAATVAIELLRQADGRLRVSFSAPDSTEANFRDAVSEMFRCG